MSILVSLTPSESKRLIGKAVASHPLVQKACKEGNILVSSGTTTGFFLEELLQEKLELNHFPCGVVAEGVLCTTPDDRITPYFIRKGKVVRLQPAQPGLNTPYAAIDELGAGDVYVKGANAIDADGMAGYLLANPLGGNVVATMTKIAAQGVHFIIPAGLEKMIPSVVDASRHMHGIYEYRYTFGRGCGYLCVPNGIIITEITALLQLTGVKATHVASGGFGGSEGAVTLVIDGTEAQELAAIKLLQSVKGEKPLTGWKMSCSECTFKCKYRFPNQ